MERRFAGPRKQLLADAEVDPGLLRDVLPRLERFLDPFVGLLQRSEQGQHARDYVAGLLSSPEYKNVESIAYLHDQEREPQRLPLPAPGGHFLVLALPRGTCPDPLQPWHTVSQPDTFRATPAGPRSLIGPFLDRCPARRHGRAPRAARETRRGFNRLAGPQEPFGHTPTLVARLLP